MKSLTLFWVVLCLTFIMLEAGTPGLFFFHAGALGALASTLFSWAGYSFAWQASAFVITSLGTLLATKYVTKHLAAFKTHHHQKTNMYALIGKRALVIDTIKPQKRGYVKINGESWAAESIQGREIAIDKEVEVIAVGGAHVKVKEIKHS